jgi:2-polyprenyl-6-methoxyphenol hydroxylase-like FAD-dependent oxidoreductase
MRKVLISGAGIAGPTLAYWLARHGFEPTVVERAGLLRSSGSPVDVRGPAVDVAERMGIMPRLRESATQVRGLSFVNASGRRVGYVPTRMFQQEGGSREVELPRGALASALYEASREHVEFLFDDSIATLGQDEGGVDVTFESAAARRFDLVIGADGLHSVTRWLTFGPEADFVRHAGLYVATVTFDEPIGDVSQVIMYNEPGRSIALHPAQSGAAFMYHGPAVPDFDHRDTEQHKRLLAAAYAGASWRAPELLERLKKADDLYFDSVSQVIMDSWSNGRVALLGDAASCVSLFGDGSTLAMAGAYTLAEELSTSPADHRAAFQRYEAQHRTLVTHLWPIAAAGSWLRRIAT